MAARRTELLEFAVLGLLHEAPQHGYELRKRLNAALGPFRALSYGTLYPCLRSLLEKGWIAEAVPGPRTSAGTTGSKRARIVYELTADGKERFQDLLREAGPTAWEDDTFDVHFAFFARTEAEVRLRILEGRRSRLEERLENIRGRVGEEPRALRQLHRRARAARPGLRRARGPLARGAHHRRAQHPGSSTPGTPQQHPHEQHHPERPTDHPAQPQGVTHGIRARRHRWRRQLRQLAGSGSRVLQGR